MAQDQPGNISPGNVSLRVVPVASEEDRNQFEATPNAQARVVLSGDITPAGGDTDVSSIPLAYQLIFVETSGEGDPSVEQPTFGEGTPACFAGNVNVRPTGDFTQERVFNLKPLAPSQANGPNSYTVHAIVSDLTPGLLAEEGGPGQRGEGTGPFILTDQFEVVAAGAADSGETTTTAQTEEETTTTAQTEEETTTTTPEEGGRTGGTTTTANQTTTQGG